MAKKREVEFGSQEDLQDVKMHLRWRIGKYLQKNLGKKLTGDELALWFKETYKPAYENKRETTSKKTDEELGKQIEHEIRAAHIKGRLEKYGVLRSRLLREGKPTFVYYCDDGSDVVDDEEDFVESPSSSTSQKESTKNEVLTKRSDEPDNEEVLYPVTIEFLREELNVYPIHIDEKYSSKMGPKGNEWLHPDIVGMENLSSGWKAEIKDYVFAAEKRKVKLWSLEIKKSIRTYNIRRYFFQAVSNSTWANFGYLAAWFIDDDAFNELRILSGLHGIGFINLDYGNPSKSQIVIPAREREDVDWSSANRLAKVNSDFRGYMDLILTVHQKDGKNIDSLDWDTPENWDDPKRKKKRK